MRPVAFGIFKLNRTGPRLGSAPSVGIRRGIGIPPGVKDFSQFALLLRLFFHHQDVGQPIPITMPHLVFGIEYSRSYEWRPLAILITNVPVMPLSSPVPEPGTTTIVIFDPLASIVASC